MPEELEFAILGRGLRLAAGPQNKTLHLVFCSLVLQKEHRLTDDELPRDEFVRFFHLTVVFRC